MLALLVKCVPVICHTKDAILAFGESVNTSGGSHTVFIRLLIRCSIISKKINLLDVNLL